MNRGVVLFCAVCIFLCHLSVAQPQYAFRVYFHDKTGSPVLSSPLVFLSQRALDRRFDQNITVDSTDRPVSPAYVDSVLTLTTGKFHLTSRWMNYMVVLLSDSTKILTLQGKNYIDSIKWVGYYTTALHKGTTATNPKFSSETSGQTAKTTGSSSYYDSSWPQTTMVNGDYLHDKGFKGKGKLIAVIDEGFANIDIGTGFDSMRNNGKLLDRYNFVTASATLNTISFHGTQCLSTMAGYKPYAYVGSAPEADYAVYCSEIIQPDQELEMDNLVAATERADSLGADIISESLGYNTFSNPGGFHSLVYNDIDGKTTNVAIAANMCTKKGMLFVASAGNEGGNSWNYILTPGDADSAITVGSVTPTKVIASNSGYGPNAAGRIKPDVCMQGQDAVVLNDGSNAGNAGGTSYATPQLAGWAACLWQAGGNSITPYQLRTAIIQSADLYQNPDNHYGYGIPDFKKAFDLLGIKDTPQNPGWSVSPNPFSKQVEIKMYLSKNDVVGIVMTDLSGRIVFSNEQSLSKGAQDLFLSMPNLSSGIYFLKITTSDNRSVVKMVKN
jgi:serine protease AprX